MITAFVIRRRSHEEGFETNIFRDPGNGDRFINILRVLEDLFVTSETGVAEPVGRLDLAALMVTDRFWSFMPDTAPVKPPR